MRLWESILPAIFAWSTGSGAFGKREKMCAARAGRQSKLFPFDALGNDSL